jgi:hypothetical protein
MMRKECWETRQHGTPEKGYFSIESEYRSDNGSILMQFYLDAQQFYNVRLTATKKDRLLPIVKLRPTRDYDAASRFAIRAMNEMEALLNDD